MARYVKPGPARIGRIAILAIKTTPPKGKNDVFEKPSKPETTSRTPPARVTFTGQMR
jgi:hypothetical protein